MSNLTDQQLKDLAALEAVALHGPWERCTMNTLRGSTALQIDHDIRDDDLIDLEDRRKNSLALVCVMRNALPGLIRELQDLRAQNSYLETNSETLREILNDQEAKLKELEFCTECLKECEECQC